MFGADFREYRDWLMACDHLVPTLKKLEGSEAVIAPFMDALWAKLFEMGLEGKSLIEGIGFVEYVYSKCLLDTSTPGPFLPLPGELTRTHTFEPFSVRKLEEKYKVMVAAQHSLPGEVLRSPIHRGTHYGPWYVFSWSIQMAMEVKMSSARFPYFCTGVHSTNSPVKDNINRLSEPGDPALSPHFPRVLEGDLEDFQDEASLFDLMGASIASGWYSIQRFLEAKNSHHDASNREVIRRHAGTLRDVYQYAASDVEVPSSMDYDFCFLGAWVHRVYGSEQSDWGELGWAQPVSSAAHIASILYDGGHHVRSSHLPDITAAFLKDMYDTLCYQILGDFFLRAKIIVGPGIMSPWLEYGPAALQSAYDRYVEDCQYFESRGLDPDGPETTDLHGRPMSLPEPAFPFFEGTFEHPFLTIGGSLGDRAYPTPIKPTIFIYTQSLDGIYRKATL